jgi:hypothetical protein
MRVALSFKLTKVVSGQAGQIAKLCSKWQRDRDAQLVCHEKVLPELFTVNQLAVEADTNPDTVRQIKFKLLQINPARIP